MLIKCKFCAVDSKFLLKGALLFSLWYDVPHRLTRDADLRGLGSDDIDTTVATFREICQIAVDDGIAFDPVSVKGGVLRKDADYSGVRIDLQTKLDGALIAVQADTPIQKTGLQVISLIQ